MRRFFAQFRYMFRKAIGELGHIGPQGKSGLASCFNQQGRLRAAGPASEVVTGGFDQVETLRRRREDLGGIVFPCRVRAADAAQQRSDAAHGRLDPVNELDLARDTRKRSDDCQKSAVSRNDRVVSLSCFHVSEVVEVLQGGDLRSNRIGEFRSGRPWHAAGSNFNVMPSSAGTASPVAALGTHDSVAASAGSAMSSASGIDELDGQGIVFLGDEQRTWSPAGTCRLTMVCARGARRCRSTARLRGRAPRSGVNP